MVCISFKELDKTSPCSLSCTERSVLGHREARLWLAHAKTDAQAGDWKLPPEMIQKEKMAQRFAHSHEADDRGCRQD